LISKGKNEAIENFSSKKTSFLCGLAETFVEPFLKFVREQRFFVKYHAIEDGRNDGGGGRDHGCENEGCHNLIVLGKKVGIQDLGTFELYADAGNV
jgi:hypothetical protein